MNGILFVFDIFRLFCGLFLMKLGKMLLRRHWKGSVPGIGKGPVAKLGKTGTDWERVRLPDSAKEGKKTAEFTINM